MVPYLLVFYTANHATFPIQIRKITVQICGNTQYIDHGLWSVLRTHAKQQGEMTLKDLKVKMFLSVKDYRDD